MTNPPIARLAFLTQPAPGRFLLTLTFGAEQHRVIDVKADETRVEIVEVSREHLALILADGANMMLRGLA